MGATLLKKLFAQAGVTINGDQPWDPQIHDRRWYGRILREKNLGLGESYMEGWWDCGRIDEMIRRLLNGGLDDTVKGAWRYALRLMPEILFNLQTMARSRMIAKRHYDLGNDLFFSFLDPCHQYSCGYFNATDDLDQAQLNKLALIGEKLQLAPGDRLLDIGCGWGGLAAYAADRYGCTVTGVNISREQLGYARAHCQGAAVTYCEGDYRTIQGQFNKVCSVGMFEHVGKKNYRIFMGVVHRLLPDEGIFLLHTIGNNISVSHCNPWITRYIFPNSMLPSLRQITQAAERFFVIEDVHNLGPHYDKTLMAWNERFQAAWPLLQERYGARFKRMWEYYLLSCAGAFRARSIQLWQVVMTKRGPGTPQPACR